MARGSSWSSLCFALLHVIHKSEAATGLIQAGSVGVILAYSFWRTGGLWFAWGWHASWDFTQTFIYGVPDSGVPARGALLASQLHGPAWLTGGTVGPEGSWFALPTLVALALLVRLALHPAPPAPQSAAAN